MHEQKSGISQAARERKGKERDAFQRKKERRGKRNGNFGGKTETEQRGRVPQSLARADGWRNSTCA